MTRRPVGCDRKQEVGRHEEEASGDREQIECGDGARLARPLSEVADKHDDGHVNDVVDAQYEAGLFARQAAWVRGVILSLGAVTRQDLLFSGMQCVFRA